MLFSTLTYALPLHPLDRLIGSDVSPQEPKHPVVIIGNVIQIVLSLLGIVFLVLVVFAGYLWMTAGGNDEQVKKAQGLLVNGIIGVIIVLGAYVISSFVIGKLIDKLL